MSALCLIFLPYCSAHNDFAAQPWERRALCLHMCPSHLCHFPIKVCVCSQPSCVPATSKFSDWNSISPCTPACCATSSAKCCQFKQLLFCLLESSSCLQCCEAAVMGIQHCGRVGADSSGVKLCEHLCKVATGSFISSIVLMFHLPQEWENMAVFGLRPSTPLFWQSCS